MDYFQSLNTNSLESFARALEDILQQEHGVDGKHQIATSSNDGFMSARDKIKLDKLLGTNDLTSKDSTTVIVSSGGGGGGTSTIYIKAGVIFNAQSSGTELDLDKTFSGHFDPLGDYAITFRCVDPTTSANINLTLIKSSNKIIFKPDYDGAKIEWKIMEIKS